MQKCGFKWFCTPCRPKITTLNSGDETECGSYKKTEALCNSMNMEMNNIKLKMEEIQEKINTNFDSLKQSLDSPKSTSWADIVGEGDKTNTTQNPSQNQKQKLDLISNLAKEVLNNQKQLSVEREERDKNVIIFGVKENLKNEAKIDVTKTNDEKADENNDDKDKTDVTKKNDENTRETDEDNTFLTKMCQEVLQFKEVPETTIQRIPANKPNRIRPMKVMFTNLWDKRKFLSSLNKLKGNDAYSNVRVAHDMCIADREENRKLLDEAYKRNITEKPTTFKYKVRGPPWAMKITKVLLQKNQ